MSDAPKGFEPRFDELIHAPTRLSIVALLAAADWADFTFVRDSLSLSDSALSNVRTWGPLQPASLNGIPCVFSTMFDFQPAQ